MSQNQNISLVDKIDACLPQTQCTRCGYPDCQSYAKAIASSQADINQCPPGGEVTIQLLSDLLNKPLKPLNEVDHGQHKPRYVADIIEDLCIGCTVCINACPVDAIIGAHKSMHSIITEDCTGCELCIPPCPMDCIEMAKPIKTHTTQSQDSAWSDYGYSEQQVDNARINHQKNQLRNATHVAANTQEIKARKISEQDRANTILDIIRRKL